MAFVLDKEGNYLQVFGTTSGGSGDNNFIPNDTIINVKLDGSGDFTTFKDALDYLTGKISDGTVKVVLGSGTFEVNGNLSFYISKVNIPRIEISGQVKDNTIINGKNTPNWNGVISIGNNNSIVCFKDLTINTENSTTGSCLKVNGGNVQIYGTTAFTNGSSGILIFGNGSVYVADCNMYFTNNANAGIVCQVSWLRFSSVSIE